MTINLKYIKKLEQKANGIKFDYKINGLCDICGQQAYVLHQFSVDDYFGIRYIWYDFLLCKKHNDELNEMEYID